LQAALESARAAGARIGPAAVAAYFSTYALSWLLDSTQQRAIVEFRPSAYGDDTTAWGYALWSTYLLLGDTIRARFYNDSARIVQERLVAQDTANFDQRQTLAHMLAAAGQRHRATQEAARALSQAEASTDSIMLPYMHDRLARIYLLLGQKDEALTH